MSEDCMTDSKFRVLRYIYRYPDVTSADIAIGTGLKRRTVTDCLKKLREGDKYVKRKKMLSDPKLWYNYATEEGKTAYISEACKRGVLGRHDW